ncbi:MAG: cbb3-type cytochrome oxidase assembly protein CcoS [Sphingobacteriales bacterium]|jgi:cbb3-type cytochrome oxidase maturation protein|nr:MAG: cbb3-type cytochrome oxidase assembly protein CcoS [Sphingobacteriales bacterium]
MNAIIILLICSLFVAVGFLVAFIWSVKDGQYEDEFSPANRILYDDQEINKNTRK